MIVTVPQAERNSIDDMQKLLDALPSSHRKRQQIELDLRKLLSGKSGEKNVNYQLEFWFRDAEDVVVANDLRLEFNGRKAQIDHLLAIPTGLMVLESKSIPDEIYIDNVGNWFRIKQTGQREGMFNPIEQNRRHIAVIREILVAASIDPLPPLGNVIVFPNSKVIVKGTRPKGASLIRIDNLQSFVERSYFAKPPIQGATLDKWIESLLPYHRPISINVFERYHIDKKEIMPMSQRVRVDEKTEAYICCFCDGKMAIQKTKMGVVWGCANYPLCKNMVQASIVAQIGQAFVDEYNKSHFWTSRRRRCPNCGDKLIEKNGRLGNYLECVNRAVCRYKEP